MVLSLDQKRVLKSLMEWYKSDKKTQYITLGGYAGTGKTTLMGVLRQELNKENKNLKVAFCSYTGKAARVLKSKLIESKSVFKQDSVSTIHSLIYSPIVNDKEEIIGWQRRNEVEANLVIIDEASMVDESIWKDILGYKIPIIAVGDHGQLPPINGSFNLMEKPILKLEEIHRQVKDNPIIRISILARERGIIPAIQFNNSVRKIRKSSEDGQNLIEEWLRAYNRNTLILCGYNHTRLRLNNYIRRMFEFNSLEPQVKDRLICLRNNHALEIFNGMLGTVVSIEKENEDWYAADIEMDDQESLYSGLISVKQFNNKESLNFTEKRSKIMKGDLFDFGYALTVHKAQGSQAKRVILFEERFPSASDEIWRRWLYTAVTRAEEELLIIGN